MDRRELPELLEQLRRELAASRGDRATREHLEKLIDEIEARLEDSTTERHESLLERIAEAVEEFETTHPRATAILNEIMMTLSNLGI
jgi:F0F1-type ATP synthase membrane subunit b/b'